MLQKPRGFGRTLVFVAALLLATWNSGKAGERVFTLDSDFDLGTLDGVNHDLVHDQLQLDESVTTHAHVWVVKSGRNTVVRIDAESGRILGEYRTAPSGRAGSPSRTAVDRFGNVWVGNQSESAGGQGSVVKVGLVVGGTRGSKAPDGSFTPDPDGSYLAPPFLYSTAVDRDGDGLIRTSRGLGHVFSWPDIRDGDGGASAEVEDAEDECILLYQRTSSTNVLHVAVDADNQVWVGGFAGASTGMDVLDGHTGRVLGNMQPACGGYGGLVDGRGVVWSASFSQNTLMRHDPRAGVTTCVPVMESAGLAVDGEGYIWNTMWDRNTVAKLDPNGVMVPGFPKLSGGRNCFGVAVTPGNDVWVANKRTNDVSRLDRDGNLRKRIAVGSWPTGVAVDALGKVWVVNEASDTVVRIDPAAGPDALGAVDQTVSLGAGARAVAYGNMAGHVESRQLTRSGTWRVVHDGGAGGVPWSTVSWKSEEPGASRITVHARAAENLDELERAEWAAMENAGDIAGALSGRWIEIRVLFEADVALARSPVLLELAVSAETNVAPDCAQAVPSIEEIWPPNGRMVAVEVFGVVDADGDAVECTIVGIMQDEPRARSIPDAYGIGTRTAYVRAARDGEGDGRVYTISYRATDARGNECTGSVSVCVPHDRGREHGCVDDGALFDSTTETPTADKTGIRADNYPNPFNPSTTIRFITPAVAPVRLMIYDALGRHVRTLANTTYTAGAHALVWNGRDDHGRPVASGIYLYRLRAGSQEIANRMLLLE